MGRCITCTYIYIFLTLLLYSFYGLNMTDVENLILYNGELETYTANLPKWNPAGGDLRDEQNRIAIEVLRHAKEFSVTTDEDVLYKNSTLSKDWLSFVVEIIAKMTFFSYR